jgi:hypothetical protein
MISKGRVVVAGTWHIGPYTYVLTQHGDRVDSQGSFGPAKGEFTGPYTFTLVWPQRGFTGTFNPARNVIDWNNGTTWMY